MDCDFVFLNLPDHSIAKNVVSGCKQQLKNVTVVNSTPSTPNQVKEMEKFVTDIGGKYLDAVIGCYPAKVGPETGYMMYSGNQSVFEFAKPALASLSPDPLYLGDNVASAEIIDLAGVGTHYGFVFNLLEGVSLCLKNDYDVKDYVNNLNGIFPLLYEAATRQVLKELRNFKGEFEDADEATLDIETHGLAIVKKAMDESGINTAFSGKNAGKHAGCCLKRLWE